MAAIMTVFELPPKLSFSSHVRGESRKGTWTYQSLLFKTHRRRLRLRLALDNGAAFCVSLKRADMQFERALKALLMWHLRNRVKLQHFAAKTKRVPA
jgi:hypothetical protein